MNTYNYCYTVTPNNYLFSFSLLQVRLQPVPLQGRRAAQRQEPPAADAQGAQHEARPRRPTQEQLRPRPVPHDAQELRAQGHQDHGRRVQVQVRK